MDETTLINQAVAGDDEALVRLLRLHAETLEASVRNAFPRRLAAQVSVEDVLQSVYTDAFLAVRRARFSGPREFSAWLHKIARNNLRDLVRLLEADKRGGARRPIVDADAASEIFLLELLAGDVATPSQSIRRDEAFLLLQKALEKLPDDQRIAVQMVDLQGVSVDDAAHSLGCSRGGVAVLRCRARQRLGEILDHHRTKFRSFL